MKLGPPPSPNRRDHPFVGSLVFHRIPIDIENAKGDVRTGVDKDGHRWRSVMHAHYGEFRNGVRGEDGDKIDVYVGPDAESQIVVIVNQNDPVTGKHDEQKCMLGFATVADALALYDKQYDRPGFRGKHVVMTLAAFRRKIVDHENDGKALAKALSDAGIQDPWNWREITEAEAAWMTLAKGLSHKYLLRFPTGKPKPKWRYVYKYQNRKPRFGNANQISEYVHHPAEHDKSFEVGSSWADATIGQHKGHWVVEAEHKDENGQKTYTVKHDETGETHTGDKWDLIELTRVGQGHHEAVNTEIARRRDTIARERKDAFDRLSVTLKGPRSPSGLKAISAQVTRLRKMDALTPQSVAEWLGVSGALPALSKLPGEMKDKFDFVGQYGQADDPTLPEGLVFDLDALKAWARLRLLERSIDSYEHQDERKVREWAEKLPPTPLTLGPESEKILLKSLKARLANRWIEKKSGYVALAVSDIKMAPSLARELRDRWTKHGFTADQRAMESAAVGEFCDKHGIAFMPVDRKAIWGDDANDSHEKRVKATQRYINSQEDKAGTPEGLGAPTVTFDKDGTADDYFAKNLVITHVIPGTGKRKWDLVVAPAHVVLEARGVPEKLAKFREEHAKKLADVKAVMADVHDGVGAMVNARRDALASEIEKIEADAALAKSEALKARRAGGDSDAYADATENAVTQRDKKIKAAQAVHAAQLHAEVRAHLGIPESAHDSNRAVILASKPETLPAGAEHYDFDADKQHVSTFLRNIHPDVMPTNVKIHMLGAGRANCSHDNVVSLHTGQFGSHEKVTMWHELGHAIEHASESIGDKVNSYLLERSKVSPKEKMRDISSNEGYEKHEVSYKDGWWHPYCGSWYGHGSSEVISMGLQEYLKDPIAFHAMDPEHFALTVAAISGKLGKRNEPKKEEAKP